MNESRIVRLVAVGALAMLAVSACGGGGGSSSGSTAPPPPPTATVSGSAGKGLLGNAIVNFYAVSNGTVGTTSLANTRTDATTGAFSASVTSGGPVVVTVTADGTTTMQDELTGTTIPAPAGLVLHAVLPSLTNVQPIGVTPLTDMAYTLASGASGGLTANNISAAQNAVDAAFLNGAPSLNTQPIAITSYKSAPVAQQDLSKLMVALEVAAKQGTATDATGALCPIADYGSQLICMLGGLGKLITLNASNQGVLAPQANYIAAAYQQVSSGLVRVAGQAPSALGLNVVTPAEKSFETAVAKQAPLPGYDPSAAPLANTKALFDDVRSNILDQKTTGTFGLAPTAAAIAADVSTNLDPALRNGASGLAAMKIATDLLAAAASNPSHGSTANINGPAGIFFDKSDGNLYVTGYNDNTILQVTTAGKVNPFAGTPGVVGSADGGPVPPASFNAPGDVAADAQGNLYVADYKNDTIRKITPQGVVSTIAGQPGNQGSNDGAGTTQAQFFLPYGLVVDASGNIYVADVGNSTIRKLTPSTGVSPTVYTVSTIAGQVGQFVPHDGVGTQATFAEPLAIAIDSNGILYVADVTFSTVAPYPATSATVRTITPDATGTVYTVSTLAVNPATSTASPLIYPLALKVDGSGNIYIADFKTNVVDKLSPSGALTTVAGSASAPGGNADGAGAAALFNGPDGVALDGTGNVYVADYYNDSIRKIDGSGNVTTVARSIASYRRNGSVYCGYDPALISPTAAQCTYGSFGNFMLMSVTPSGAGAFGVQTQTLTPSFTPPAPGSNPILAYYTISSAPALAATLTLSTASGTTLTATGPLYVTSAGGQVTANMSANASSDWNPAAVTGTLSVSGSLSAGAGGVDLSSASFAPDSKLVLANLGLLRGTKLPLLPVGSAPSAQGVLDVSAATSAYSYAIKLTIGAPTADKSTKLQLPASIDVVGSVTAAGATAPIFTGDVAVAFQGVSTFDVTQAYSTTNFVTVQLQVNGDLALSSGRVLTVNAAVNGTQLQPAGMSDADSLTATYTYATPSGTALLNVTGTYDSTDGYAATITNNGGVKATFTMPVGGTLSGTVTDNGTATATVSGTTISYSDGTTASLY